MQWGSRKLKIVSQVLIYFTTSITFIFAIDLALSCLPCFCTFYILFFNISEMGEPPVLILWHSFICRLNSFITNSTHLDHHFLLHEDTHNKRCGEGGQTVEKTIRYDLQVVQSFVSHIVILQLGTNDLSHLDSLVTASAIEDLVGILYNEHSVQQISVCQTLNRKNDAAFFNTRVKALTKYLKVLLTPIPWCYLGVTEVFGILRRDISLEMLFTLISWGTISMTKVSGGGGDLLKSLHSWACSVEQPN